MQGSRNEYGIITVNETVLNKPKYFSSLILWRSCLLLWWQPSTLYFYLCFFLLLFFFKGTLCSAHSGHSLSQLHDIVSQDAFLNIPEGVPSGAGQVLGVWPRPKPFWTGFRSRDWAPFICRSAVSLLVCVLLLSSGHKRPLQSNAFLACCNNYL